MFCQRLDQAVLFPGHSFRGFWLLCSLLFHKPGKKRLLCKPDVRLCRKRVRQSLLKQCPFLQAQVRDSLCRRGQKASAETPLLRPFQGTHRRSQLCFPLSGLRTLKGCFFLKRTGPISSRGKSFLWIRRNSPLFRSLLLFIPIHRMCDHLKKRFQDPHAQMLFPFHPLLSGHGCDL